MANKNQHVVPHGKNWAVKGAGNTKATSIHKTQKGAIDAARETCKSFGAFLCDKALPADVLDVLLVDLLLSVFEALEAAFFPVTFLFFLFPMFFSY
jgi:hypothetical protein